MFQRFFDEGLAQASFLVGCDRTRRAVVIDPRRDTSVYSAAARLHGATIVAAIETHVHADFVSGARELAEKGASVMTGPGSDLAFAHLEVHDGEQLPIGDLTLTFLHTPGHTPEHISILAELPAQPVRLFTGDLLFVGGVGRPDLLGEAQMRGLASDLFDSLQRVMASRFIPGTAPDRSAAPASARTPRRRSPGSDIRTRCCSTAIVRRSSPRCWPTFRQRRRISRT
jgi:hydroxyacylglutathione hydrolase